MLLLASSLFRPLEFRFPKHLPLFYGQGLIFTQDTNILNICTKTHFNLLFPTNGHSCHIGHHGTFSNSRCELSLSNKSINKHTSQRGFLAPLATTDGKNRLIMKQKMWLCQVIKFITLCSGRSWFFHRANCKMRNKALKTFTTTGGSLTTLSNAKRWTATVALVFPHLNWKHRIGLSLNKVQLAIEEILHRNQSVKELKMKTILLYPILALSHC